MKKYNSDISIINLSLSVQMISQPMDTISNFFSIYHYPDAVRHLKRLIKMIFENSKANNLDDHASEIIFFYENLIQLLEISWVITQQETSDTPATIEQQFEDQSQMLNPILYTPKAHRHLAFQFFPRNLSSDEFRNPYQVFPKLFKHYSLTEWKDQLNNIFHLAMSRYAGNVCSTETNLYILPRLLSKMIDASHLINVREEGNPTTPITINETSTEANVEKPTDQP